MAEDRMLSDEILLGLIKANSGGGGGGTKVVANPSAEATDALEKIQIGDTVYDIVGGGSGGEDDTNYLYNGEAEPENFTMPSGTTMQPLFTGKYGMDFKGGAGDFIKIATSKTAIDFTDISTLKFSGLHYDGFNVMLGSFIESVDVSNIIGLKYLSVGYRTTNLNNSAVYAITDTTTVTSNDVVALKTKTGATDVSMFTQIIAE